MMRNTPACLLMAAGALCLVGCNNTATDTTKDVQSLKDNETQWNADFASKDAAKIVAHYSDDATLIVYGDKPASGKDAITAAFKGMTSDPAFSLQLNTQKAVVASGGTLGYTQGTYTLTLTNPMDQSVIHDAGTYLTVYQKATDGTWKAVSDAPVSSVPPPPPPVKQ